MSKTFNSLFFSAAVLLVAVVLLAVGPVISQAQFVVYTESFE